MKQKNALKSSHYISYYKIKVSLKHDNQYIWCGAMYVLLGGMNDGVSNCAGILDALLMYCTCLSRIKHIVGIDEQTKVLWLLYCTEKRRWKGGIRTIEKGAYGRGDVV